MLIRYNSFNSFLKKKFPGFKVRKIPVNAGFPCPNKNGEISDAGCIFCDQFGSGPIRYFSKPIRSQIEMFLPGEKNTRFIAYYQANSNTCAPPEVLNEKYNIIFDYKEIIGLFIGTRPDAIADDAFPILSGLRDRTYLSVELGLQSVHARSLELLNRNHSYEAFLTAFGKLKDLGIDVIVHLIIGIPGETLADMTESVREMNRLKPAGVKFHLLHVLKDTELFRRYERGDVRLMEMDEYVGTVTELIAELDEDIVVHRITGERDTEIFHAPKWALDKASVISAIHKRMEENGLRQGCRISNH
jgi:radical SAM protein (TIGR01212 family)